MALHVSPRLPPWTDANARWTPARLGARPARPQGAGGERPAGDERTGANPIELSAIRSAGYHRSGEERTPLSYPTYFQRLTRKKGLVFEQMYVQGPRPIADSPNLSSTAAARFSTSGPGAPAPSRGPRTTSDRRSPPHTPDRRSPSLPPSRRGSRAMISAKGAASPAASAGVAIRHLRKQGIQAVVQSSREKRHEALRGICAAGERIAGAGERDERR